LYFINDIIIIHLINIPLTEIFALLATYGYIVVFPIAVAEGPIISVLSGFLVGSGVFNPYIAFTVLLMGDVLGDSIYYAIGRYGGRKVIPKVSAYFGTTPEKMTVFEEKFHKNDWKILLFAKTQAVGSIVLMTAGFVKMSFTRFVFVNALGSAPKIILFMVIGYYFGRAYLLINTYMGYFAAIWLFLAVLIILLYIYFKKHKSKKNI